MTFVILFDPGTIEISEFNDWSRQSQGGRVLLGIQELLVKLIADKTSVSVVSLDATLTSWLTPVNPESDLAKRIDKITCFGN